MADKLRKVTLEYDDRVEIITGEECEKWEKMIHNACAMGRAHGMRYPIILWKTVPKTKRDVGELMSNYWDCECPHNYIRYKLEEKCYKCGAERDEQPDSRQNEWLGQFSGILKRVYGLYTACLSDARSSLKLDYKKDERVSRARNICKEVIWDGLQLGVLEVGDYKSGKVEKRDCFNAWLDGNIGYRKRNENGNT